MAFFVPFSDGMIPRILEKQKTEKGSQGRQLTALISNRRSEL
jgi:hypothetical protein